MVFAYFLGMCSYLAVSKNVKTAFGLGLAVCFVLTITVPVNYLIDKYLLREGALTWLSASFAGTDLSFLSLIIFIAVIAGIVQLLEMVFERYLPALYMTLGIFLPLIAVNCAILGGSLFMQERNFPTVAHSLAYALGSGIGWLLAITAFAAIRERLKYAKIPPKLQGNGIAYIITGLLGMGFMAFLGMPNYNSAVATFCNNIANDLPITVNDPSVKMHLVYIDDVVDELIGALSGKEHHNGLFCEVPVTHHITLGGIVDLLHSFHDMHDNLEVPDFSDAFARKLYSTYLSYLPEAKTIYPLKMNIDQRGSFTEIIRTPDRGQVSINISKPGITKGQHWHHTKNEKFVVVSGHGLIQLRREGVDEQGNPYPVREYEVSGEHIQVVEMLPGFTHNIINLSDTDDLVTLMWANEAFNPNRPDTYFDPVI